MRVTDLSCSVQEGIIAQCGIYTSGSTACQLDFHAVYGFHDGWNTSQIFGGERLILHVDLDADATFNGSGFQE